MSAKSEEGSAQVTACILCSLNCGIEVEVADGRFSSIRGDKSHPLSRGYTCQKAQRLDYYQNSSSRVTEPLRRKVDGTFEPVSWERAIREIASKIEAIRDAHGGHALAYYGGGGQGNHLGGAYSGSLRQAMGTRYVYTALAQEKTGGFWVDGRLFGEQSCHPTEDVENADFLLIIGANPWQSHGFPRARHLLQELARDPSKTLVVVDPRRTETAEKADIHLQVRPGGDAHLLLAMLGTILQEGLEDREFLATRTVGFETIARILRDVPVDEYAELAGVDAEQLRAVARGYASAERACLRTDLGLEHTLHSTLNVYLAKLLFLITGHFGKPGTNVFHTALAPLVKHSKDPSEGGRTTRVTGAREIGGLYPPNVLPLEIDTDHPERIRGVFVESGNPLITGADTAAYERAFRKLDLLVVVDIAMTETAALAHYVLPAATQFEKTEATFFNLDFPDNYFHLRRPLLPPRGKSLPEPEIHRRLAVALGQIPERFPILEAVAKLDRRWPALRLFPMALMLTLKLRPRLSRHLPLLLHQTLGRSLPKGTDGGAVLWGACQLFLRRFGKECVERAGIHDQGAGLAEALFQRILESPSGTIISRGTYEETWRFLKHKDGRIHLAIPELIESIESLVPPATDDEFPLILQAGERRSYNANTIYREPDWRKKDREGALDVHPDDAASLGLTEGSAAWCETDRARICVRVHVTDEVRRGMVSLPHGYGMFDPSATTGPGTPRSGPPINFLTSSDHCDEISKVPFHKFVPARVRAVLPGEEAVVVGQFEEFAMTAT